MIYKKPNNITYTQMAIIIDDMVASNNYDDDLLFEYLYHLSFMLANQNKYFKTLKLYEDFSIYTATSVFLRLKNSDKSKIKSILNYLKKVLYFRKIAFERSIYCDDFYLKSKEIDTISIYSFSTKLSDIAYKYNVIEFQSCLNSMTQTIKNWLKRIPYIYKSNEWYSVYMSCMLTILNYITLSNKDIEKLSNMIYKVDDENFINELYAKQRDSVILYHLDDMMKDYIYILVKQIIHIISIDLSDIYDCRLLDNDINNALILNEINSKYKASKN